VDGDNVTLTRTGVTQDEPVTGPDDRTKPDAQLASASNKVYIRAERAGDGNGRVYRVAFRATDGKGASRPAQSRSSFPIRKGATAVDSAPRSYDSFAY
jgi:hypothetical protein